MRVVGTNMIYRHHHPKTTCERELADHHGQQCKVVRRLSKNETGLEVGHMYNVRFKDNFESHVFQDELFKEDKHACK